MLKTNPLQPALQKEAEAQPNRQQERLSRAEALRERQERHLQLALTLAAPLLLLGIWEALSEMGILDPRFFPPPSRILMALWQMLLEGSLWQHVRISLIRILLGFLLGSVPGILVGLAIGLWKPVRALLSPLIAVLMPIPTMALVPLIMILFGIGELSKWVTIATSVFFPVAINTAAGVASIDAVYLEVARNFGASRLAFFTRIALPGALPVLFEGLQMGEAIALLTIVAAEMVAANSGIGYLIWSSYKTFQIPQMFVGLLAIAILGYVFSLLLRMLGRQLTRWR